MAKPEFDKIGLELDSESGGVMNPVDKPGTPGTPPPSTEPPANDPPPVDTTIEIDGNSYKLNANGDAVDTSGTVVKTKDEIDTLLNSIVIDDVTYKLNSNGDAVDDKGAVKYTKSQIDDYANPSTATIDDVIKQINFVPSSNGKPVTYENNVEGITSYIKDYSNYVGEQAFQDGAEAILAVDPVVGRLVDYIKVNGTSKGFDFNVNPADFKYEENKEESVKRLIVHSRTLKGDTEDEANAYYEYLKKEGKAIDAAKAAEPFIQKHYADIDNNNKQILADREAEVATKQAKFWGVNVDPETGEYSANEHTDSIYHKVVKLGKLNVDGKDLSIPEHIRVPLPNGKTEVVGREDFFEYLFVPIPVDMGDGSTAEYTPFELDSMMVNSKETTDDFIVKAFKMFVKQEQNQLIESNISKRKLPNQPRIITTGNKGGGAKTNKPLFYNKPIDLDSAT